MGRQNRKAIEILAVTAMLNTVVYCDSSAADGSEVVEKYIKFEANPPCIACNLPSRERETIPGTTRGDKKR